MLHRSPLHSLSWSRVATFLENFAELREQLFPRQFMLLKNLLEFRSKEIFTRFVIGWIGQNYELRSMPEKSFIWLVQTCSLRSSTFFGPFVARPLNNIQLGTPATCLRPVQVPHHLQQGETGVHSGTCWPRKNAGDSSKIGQNLMFQKLNSHSQSAVWGPTVWAPLGSTLELQTQNAEGRVQESLFNKPSCQSSTLRMPYIAFSGTVESPHNVLFLKYADFSLS